MKENLFDLSIIIVSFNTRDLTRQCLQSIYKNTDRIRFEIWVIDNGSSDGSAEMIEREFPDVNLIRNKNNRGLAAATNQGLEKSEGRYVLTLNSDTVILPDTFEKLVRFMDLHPEAGAATPRLVLEDGSPHSNFIGKLPTLKSDLLGVLCRTRLANKLQGLLSNACYGNWTDYSRTQEVPFILWGTCFVVRRDVLKTVGLQDPRFFVYSEDWDWALRIVKSGWKLYYVADATIIHFGGLSTKQSSGKMNAQFWKSRCRVLQKHSGLMAGLTLRTAVILIFGLKILKLFIFSTCRSSESLMNKTSMRQMQEIIRAVLTY